MKRLAVKDANVLIDLWGIGLLELIFELNIEVHTTDLVVNEIEQEEQSRAIQNLINEGKLLVHTFTPKELAELVVFQMSHSSLSLEDCSVWSIAGRLQAILLTGDGALRKKAAEAGLEVHGSLWLLDKLVKQSLVDIPGACAALRSLMKKNPRLPIAACKEREAKWCGG
jgi:predicted nucleic acid-binding protein